MATQTRLPTRQLGKDGPHVAALGFGLMGLSSFYGEVPEDEERFKLLDAALERGETNWDSSDLYGDSEDLLGKWFKRTGKREEIFLATKFAITKGGVRSDPPYVKEACDKSLKKLGVETVDLYYCHRVDGKTPIEETVKAMAELKKEGKVKYLGLSECSAQTLRRACAVHQISAVQMEYSPFTLDIESSQTNLLKTCRELGVAVIAYSPLGRGMLTGTLKSPDDFAADDWRRNAPRFSKENFHKNLEAVEVISNIAKHKGHTPGQVSLAWLMAQGDDIIPIPGTKKLKYLEENLGAVKVQLTPDEISEIRKAAEAAEITGARYPGGGMQLTFGDTPELKHRV